MTTAIPNPNHAAYQRLRTLAEAHIKGSCKMLSVGDECICYLCDLERLWQDSQQARDLESITTGLRAQVTELETTILGLTHFSAKPGSISADITGTAVRVFSTVWATWFREHAATNYIELQLVDPLDRQRYILTMQRWTGRTPHQLRQDAEAVVAQQTARIAVLEQLLTMLQQLAVKGYRLWDQDQEHKLGSLLAALGGTTGLYPQLDELRAQLTTLTSATTPG